jgi:hypothetical protein
MSRQGGRRRWAAAIAAVSLIASASSSPSAIAFAPAENDSTLGLAAPRRFDPITGRLSKRGLTVIAIASNGRASTDEAPRGRFNLSPPAGTVTLHLRGTDGTYAGPVVVDTDGRRAIMGVEAGADLGRIKVRKGYGEVSRQPSEDEVDPRQWSRARKGVPIGAEVYGLVRSRPKKKVPGDRDLDGIPGALDIDDDGDLVLDNFESAGRGRLSPGLLTPVEQTYNPFGLYSVFGVELPNALNANAAAVAVQDIDASLKANSHLFMDISDFAGASVELDCTGLSYCSPGGTGEVWCSPTAQCPTPPQSFPDCCDPDGDGFGSLSSADGFYRLRHGAPSDQIGTGDVLIARVTAGGVETEYPATLQMVFATVPALFSYGDTAGNTATVTYPFVDQPGSGDGYPLPVAAGPGGDIVLTFTFWRPQRTPSSGGGLPWVDIGGLTYYTGLVEWKPGAGAPVCPAGTYSTTDPNLTPAPDVVVGGFTGGYRDLAPDRPADPANTITYSVNMTQCLTALGETWDPGEELVINFYTRNDSYDDNRVLVRFQRQ